MMGAIGSGGASLVGFQSFFSDLWLSVGDFTFDSVVALISKVSQVYQAGRMILSEINGEDYTETGEDYTQSQKDKREEVEQAYIGNSSRRITDPHLELSRRLDTNMFETPDQYMARTMTVNPGAQALSVPANYVDMALQLPRTMATGVTVGVFVQVIIMGIMDLFNAVIGGMSGGGGATGSAMGGFDDALNFGTGAASNLVSDPISSLTDINTGPVLGDANQPALDYASGNLGKTASEGTDFMSGFKDLMGGGGFGDLFKMGMAIPQFLEQRSQNDEMMKMMKQQMSLQEREADRYRQSLNSGMRDRQRGRLAATDENGKNIVNPHYQSVSDYMKENRIA